MENHRHVLRRVGAHSAVGLEVAWRWVDRDCFTGLGFHAAAARRWLVWIGLEVLVRLRGAEVMAAVSSLWTQLRRWRLTFGVHAGVERGNVVLAPCLPYYRDHGLLMHLPAVVDLRQDCSQVDEVLPWVSHHCESLPRRLRIFSFVAGRR